MYTLKTLGLLLLCAISVVSYAKPSDNRLTNQTAITEKNWHNHPLVQTSRAVYAQVQSLTKEQELYVQIKKVPYCKAYVPIYKEIHKDRNTKVRFYMIKTGSADSAMTLQGYYDTAGMLRFVFIQGGAVMNSRIEKRMYFDDTGKQIWQSLKVLQGGNYFGDEFDIAHFKKPMADFLKQNECEKEFVAK